jgi:adenosylhomocysteine nucleosidase
MGPEQARLAGRSLLEEGVTALLSWGGAAALNDRLTAGGLVLPEQVIAADNTMFAVDPSWHQSLYRHLSNKFLIFTEPIVESRVVVTSSLHKGDLFKRSGAIAVDMESAALARLAKELRIPYVVIRSIVDTARMTIPKSLLDAIDETGQIRLLELGHRLIRHPDEWPAVIKLARNFRSAQSTLIQVARQLSEDFLFRDSNHGAETK